MWKLLEWLSLTVIEDITPIGHMLANLGSLPNVPWDILSVHYALDRPFYEGFIQPRLRQKRPAWERINIADPAVKVAEGELNIPAAIEEVITLARAENGAPSDLDRGAAAVVADLGCRGMSSVPALW